MRDCRAPLLGDTSGCFCRPLPDLARSSFGVLALGVRQQQRGEAQVVGAPESIAWRGILLQGCRIAPVLLAQCFQLLGDAE